MKNITFSLFVTIIVSIACKTEQIINQAEPLMAESPQSKTTANKISIKIGNNAFSATLTDTPAAKAFVAQLPLTLTMIELNNNEKYAQLPKSVPTNASVPASIQVGDVMMYGSSTLVLFYKGFSTTYSYTKVGKIDDVNGLAAALGTGNVEVRFEVKE